MLYVHFEHSIYHQVTNGVVDKKLLKMLNKLLTTATVS